MQGRVDCIRSASPEALEWAKAMCQGEGANVALESDKEEEEESRKVTFSIYAVSYNTQSFRHKNPLNIFNLQKDRLQELFRIAAARQTEIMVQNILGNGIDIPLLGLREASKENDGDYHELFTDETYKIAQCFMLSTSQVTNRLAACSLNSKALNVKCHQVLHNKNFQSTINFLSPNCSTKLFSFSTQFFRVSESEAGSKFLALL